MLRTVIPALAFLLGACADVRATADNQPPTVPPPVPSPPLCPVQYSNSWRAWVDVLPGPGRTGPTLHVVGNVKLLDGRPSVAFRPSSQVAGRAPVKVVVDLEPNPNGSGQAADSSVREVRGSWPSEAQIGEVTVRCLDTTLATIAPVETAH